MLKLTSTKVNILAAVAGCALVVGYAPLASACTCNTQVSNTHYHSVTKTTTEIKGEAGETVKHFSNVNVHEHTVTHGKDKDMTNVVSNVHETTKVVVSKDNDKDESKAPCNKPEVKETNEEQNEKKNCPHTNSAPSAPKSTTGSHVLGASTTAPAATVASATLADTGESAVLPSLGAAILMTAASLVKFPVFGRIKKMLGR